MHNKVGSRDEFDRTIENLLNKDLIRYTGEALNISPTGIQHIKNYDHFGEDEVFGGNYDHAVLKLLYLMDEPVPFDSLPTSLLSPPSLEGKGMDNEFHFTSYIQFKSSIKLYVSVVDRHFMLTDTGKSFYEYSIKKKTTEELPKSSVAIKHFVNPSRIEELKNIKSSLFDFRKLIRLCEEINDCYNKNNFFAVGMIARAILDHIPPIFKFTNFEQVASNYGGPKENRSFRSITRHLNEAFRSIADGFLHNHIRSKESLPNETQVNFKQDLDCLLGEVIRVSE